MHILLKSLLTVGIVIFAVSNNAEAVYCHSSALPQMAIMPGMSGFITINMSNNTRPCEVPVYEMAGKKWKSSINFKLSKRKWQTISHYRVAIRSNLPVGVLPNNLFLLAVE